MGDGEKSSGGFEGGPSSSRTPSHYEVLGLEPGAKPEDVGKAYRTRAKAANVDFGRPSLSESDKAVKDDQLRRLNLAHDTLTDLKLRAEYDKRLEAEVAQGQSEEFWQAQREAEERKVQEAARTEAAREEAEIARRRREAALQERLRVESQVKGRRWGEEVAATFVSPEWFEEMDGLLRAMGCTEKNRGAHLHKLDIEGVGGFKADLVKAKRKIPESERELEKILSRLRVGRGYLKGEGVLEKGGAEIAFGTDRSFLEGFGDAWDEIVNESSLERKVLVVGYLPVDMTEEDRKVWEEAIGVHRKRESEREK